MSSEPKQAEAKEQAKTPLWESYRRNSAAWFCLVLGMMFYLIAGLCWNALDRPNGNEFATAMVAFGLLGTFCMVVAFVDGYYRRNIKGYLMCYDVGITPWDKPNIVARDDLRIYLHEHTGLVLTIPIGGWFARPKLFANGLVLTDWQMTNVTIDLGPYNFIRVRHPEKHPTVTLRVEVLLQEIAHRPDPANLTPFWDMELAMRRLHKEAGEKTIADLLSLAERFRSLVLEACARIKATKRLEPLGEGRAIRLWLTEELVKLLPEGDKRRASLQAELAEEMAKAKKPPKPPPPPQPSPAPEPATT